VYSTSVTRHVRAPRAAVYRALTDPEAVARWRVPDGMHAVVHEFDARVGGRFRISLVYDAPGAQGKSSTHTDTYGGVFVELVPGERVVEEIEFETDEASLQGPMTMSTDLVEREHGTDVHVVHDGVPDAVPAADNEVGMRMALSKLALLVESDAD